MRTLISKRTSHAVRRRGTLAAGMAAVVGIFVVATAAPAFAHNAVPSGSTVCANGDHVVTWTIGSANTPLPMTIDVLTATLNGTQQFAINGAAVGGSVPAESSISASTIVPGGLTGTIVLRVAGSWSDGHADDQSASVALSSACGPDTTTTTEATTSTTGDTTSTTEAPTSTTEASTSTTIEGATTTTLPSTTTVSSTPIDTEGSTVQPTTTTSPVGGLGSTSPTTSSVITAAATTPGSTTGALPFTGSSDSGPIIGLSSLVAGAFALVFARRKHQS